jgi:hypothetical protein
LIAGHRRLTEDTLYRVKKVELDLLRLNDAKSGKNSGVDSGIVEKVEDDKAVPNGRDSAE